MFSIIIPTYNRRELLLKTIKSVISQTFGDFEIIIVDDGSIDNTFELFKDKIDPRIRYERLKKNSGVNVARNKGIELAKGDFLIFLDSDDELFPHALEKIFSVLKKELGSGVISAPFKTQTGLMTGFERTSGPMEYPVILCGIGEREIKNGLIAIRREILGDVRFVAPNLDFVFYRKLAKKTTFYYIEEALGQYNISTDQNSLHNKRKIPNVKLSIVRAGALVDFLKEFGNDIIKHCPNNYGYYAYGASIGLLLEGRKKETGLLMNTAIKYQPSFFQYKLVKLLAIIPFSRLILRFLFFLKFFYINFKIFGQNLFYKK